jgi:hypothetical protein
MDPKKDPRKDILAEVDLAGLFEKRTEAVKKQKEAEANVQTARLIHLFVFWIGGCAALLAAVIATQMLPENDAVGRFLLPAAVVLWIAAFFPAVRHLQDKVTAATRNVKDMENKIAFCHQVLEEAKNVKVRKYAEAWVEKEMSKA